MRWPALLRALIPAASLACLAVACQPQPTARPLTAEEVVTKTTDAAKTLESVKVVVTVQGVAAPIATGLGLTRAEGDLRRPADANLKLRLMFGTTALESELRAVDGRTFIRNPLGSRFEELRGVARMALLDPEVGLVTVIPKIVEPRLVGQETEGNVTLHRIEGRIPAAAVAQLIGGTPTSELVPLQASVRETDWFVRKLLLSGIALIGDQSDVVRTIELSGWNQPVTIPTPPAG